MRNISVSTEGVGRFVVGLAPVIEVVDGVGIEIQGGFAPGWDAQQQTLGVSRK